MTTREYIILAILAWWLLRRPKPVASSDVVIRVNDPSLPEINGDLVDDNVLYWIWPPE